MQPIKRANLDLFEHDPEETIIGEIPRHPIGIYFIIFNAIVVILAILVGLYFAVRYEDRAADVAGIAGNVDITGWLTVLAIAVTILVIVGSFIAYIVYLGNYIVITDQKLILVYAKNIFARRVSQLSIGDVQDVTVDQPGFVARFFHYGTINIETAGEQAHFTFGFTPDPYEAAKAIVDAHEQNLKKYGN